MKEKVIEHLQMVDKYHYALDSDIEEHAEAIDTLYQGEIDKLKEIIQAQDKLCKMAFDKNYHWNISRQIELQELVEKLKREAGL